MAPIADAFWVFDDDNYPCRCCSAVDAIEADYWTCKERRWLIVDEAFLAEHTAATCDGSCGDPLHAAFICELTRAELSGIGWGDVQYQWDLDELLALSPSEKAARDAAAAAEDAEKARLAPLLAEHHAQVDRMRRCRQIAHEKRNKGRKEAAPCRSLYDYQREGGCQSLSVCTECWAHEFTDSLSSEIVDEKTGRFLPMAETLGIRNAMAQKECGIFRKDGKYVLKWMPHVCYMSHPGEATWNPEWTQNRNAARAPRGAPVAAPRGADPRGGGRGNGFDWRASAVPAAAPPVNKPPTNRFANLDNSAW